MSLVSLAVLCKRVPLILLATVVISCGGESKDEGAGIGTASDTVAASTGYTVVSVADAGTIHGRVIYSGTPPAAPKFEITADAEVCGGANEYNRLKIGADGGVADAVVLLEGVRSGKPMSSLSAGPLTVEQRGCRYDPHIVVAPVDAEVTFLNDDPIPHNVRVEDATVGKILLNRAQGAQGMKDAFKVPHTGPFSVACDYHPWMNAYVFGVDNPYVALSGSDGTFSIDGVPPGSYTVKLWFNGITLQRKLDNRGTLIGYGYSDPIVLTHQVTVTPGARVETTFDLAKTEATTTGK